MPSWALKFLLESGTWALEKRPVFNEMSIVSNAIPVDLIICWGDNFQEITTLPGNPCYLMHNNHMSARFQVILKARFLFDFRPG